MRAAAAVLAVLVISTSSASASATDPDRRTEKLRASVAFVRTVSGPTPFTDDCGAAGDAFADAEVEPHLSVNPKNPNPPSGHLAAGPLPERRGTQQPGSRVAQRGEELAHLNPARDLLVHRR